jgi:hypothetical protein
MECATGLVTSGHTLARPGTTAPSAWICAPVLPDGIVIVIVTVTLAPLTTFWIRITIEPPTGNADWPAGGVRSALPRG